MIYKKTWVHCVQRNSTSSGNHEYQRVRESSNRVIHVIRLHEHDKKSIRSELIQRKYCLISHIGTTSHANFQMQSFLVNMSEIPLPSNQYFFKCFKQISSHDITHTSYLVNESKQTTSGGIIRSQRTLLRHRYVKTHMNAMQSSILSPRRKSAFHSPRFRSSIAQTSILFLRLAALSALRAVVSRTFLSSSAASIFAFKS